MPTPPHPQWSTSSLISSNWVWGDRGVGGWRDGRGDALPISDAEGLCWVAGNTAALRLPPGHLLIYGAPTALICLGCDHPHHPPTPPPPPTQGLWATVRLYLTLEMSTWTNEGVIGRTRITKVAGKGRKHVCLEAELDRQSESDGVK